VLSTFRGRVRWTRKQAGLTQVALAKQAGIHKDTLSGWETGSIKGTDVREPNLRAVASVLGVTVEWLREGGPTPRIRLQDAPDTDTPTPGAPQERKAVRDLREAEAAIQAQLKRDYTDQGRSPPAYLIVGWLKTLLEAGGATPPDEPPAAAGPAGGRHTPPAGATLPPAPPSLRP
jgi:transcriptional regulator with XRE-family HTH domain